jgi:hypothetical protein
VPRYAKGQHLRNHDLRIFNQARAEFDALHGAALAQHAPAMTEKELTKAVKALIRQRVIKSKAGAGAGAGGKAVNVVATGRAGIREEAGGKVRGGAGKGGGDGGKGRGASVMLPAIASEAAAAEVSFLENPLLAVARASAAAAAAEAGAAASAAAAAPARSDAAAAVAAAQRVHEARALKGDELERSWHLQGSEAAPFVEQSLTVSLVHVASEAGGAAQYVRFSAPPAQQRTLLVGRGAFVGAGCTWAVGCPRECLARGMQGQQAATVIG